MSRSRLSDGSFFVQAVQPHHIEHIRQWRNAQIDVLRQSTEISPDDQEAYYRNVIWPDMNSPQPKNILLTYMEEDNLIGYGGLVHISWEHRRAEVSFLLDTRLAGKHDDHTLYFPAFLRLMQTLAFENLGLVRLCTETYAIRKDYIVALEESGFNREGVLKHHVQINKRPVDSLIHGCLRSYDR